MFEKTLQDIIRGIRSHPDDEAGYISKCMDEIRKELSQPSVDMKANALSKLTYLQMLGYDASWAAFHAVEVMTGPKYAHKRIGFLAACQIFTEDTDVLIMTTQMIRKALSSQNQYISGLALNALANFVSHDLARDLGNDVMGMMSSVRPYVKKRATLVMYKLFLRYPEALRVAFPRLKDKLDDDTPAVQAAAVNVICELARKNPKNYISLAPKFFNILTTSQNNWMRIKIVKLFAALCREEKRLGAKLIEPLTTLIQGTPATSLLFECISTVLVGVPTHTATIQLCVQKLRFFIEDEDQNLKYLGLQAMTQVLGIAPKEVLPHRDLIVNCLDDRDESIRLRALDLLAGMVSKKTLVDIVRKLLQHLEVVDGHTYRDEVVAKIIEMCSKSMYKYVTDFEWYIRVLVQLTRVENTKHGKLLCEQIMDVTIRVGVLRAFAVEQMVALLGDARLYTAHCANGGVSEVLRAAAWIVGEFGEHLVGDKPEAAIIRQLLSERTFSLPAHIQAVYVHNALKLYACAAKRLGDSEGAAEELLALRDIMNEQIAHFVTSGDLEVQERAVLVRQVLQFVSDDLEKGHTPDADVIHLFAGDLPPVAPKAQKKVPVPESVDLDAWINSPPESSDEDDAEDGDFFQHAMFAPGSSFTTATEEAHHESEDEGEVERRRAERAAQVQANPYHLGLGTSGTNSTSSLQLTPQAEVDDIPIEPLNLGDFNLSVEPSTTSFDVVSTKVQAEKAKKKKKKKKLSKKEKKKMRKRGIKVPDSDEDDSDASAEEAVAIISGDVLPEGVDASDDEAATKDDDNPYAALNMDLDTPLKPGERMLPTPQHRISGTTAAAADTEKTKKEKKRKKEKKSKKKKKHSKEDGSETSSQVAVTAATVGDDGDDEAEDEADANPLVLADVSLGTDDAAQENSALNDWLDSSSSKPKKASKQTSSSKDNDDKSSKKKKKKKSKSDKKEKKEKEKGASQAANAYTNLRPLVKDDTVAVAFNTKASAEGGLEFHVIVKNHASNVTAKQLKFISSNNTFAETLGVDGSVGPGATTELTFPVTIQSDAALPAISGTITYTAEAADSDGSAAAIELVFTATLQASELVFPAASSHDEFAALLAGDALCTAQALSLNKQGVSFDSAVAAINNIAHMQVVEVVDGAVSVYGKTVAGSHICMLIKDSGEDVAIDGKATSAEQLALLLAELSAKLQ